VDLVNHAGPTSLEIVVPARNEARRLPGGVAALCQKAAGLPLPVTILVVDSASTDGTSAVVRDGPRLRSQGSEELREVPRYEVPSTT
jgi:hypothetical protein